MLSRGMILEVERATNRQHELIHVTASKRSESPEARSAWQNATDQWHASVYPTDQLWEDDFLSRLRASHREAIEDAILYLEVDPWYFRSGYLKERLIRRLKAAVLTEKDRERLRKVIWKVASGKNRREWSNYCSLAVVVANAEMVELLEAVTPERDAAAQGKFSYLLAALRRSWRGSSGA